MSKKENEKLSIEQLAYNSSIGMLSGHYLQLVDRFDFFKIPHDLLDIQFKKCLDQVPKDLLKYVPNQLQS